MLRNLHLFLLSILFLGASCGQFNHSRPTYYEYYDASWKKQHGPLSRGPLHHIEMKRGTVADTFRSGSYVEVILNQPVKVYRVYGGPVSALGKFWSRTKPSGPMQAQLDAAINQEWGNTMAFWASVTIPEGTRIFEGKACPQYIMTINRKHKMGHLLGGGDQIYIIDRVDKQSWQFEQGAF